MPRVTPGHERKFFMHLNKAMIIGNLTRDPEVRTTPSGQTVATFGVATNFAWTDQSGQKQQRAEFHNVVAWRKLAEICGAYLHKGKQVYIEGRLQTRDWTDQSGVRKYRTEIIAENMIMLGAPRPAGAAPAAPSAFPRPQTAASTAPQFTPDVPVIDYETPSNINPGVEDYQVKSDADREEEVKVEDIPF